MRLHFLRLHLLQSRPVRRWCALRARGDAAVADVVFVRDGVIEGPAPSRKLVTIDV